MSKLNFALEYWNGIDELIFCDTVFYNGEVQELDGHEFECCSMHYEIGKFNNIGYFERILKISVM